MSSKSTCVNIKFVRIATCTNVVPFQKPVVVGHNHSYILDAELYFKRVRAAATSKHAQNEEERERERERKLSISRSLNINI